MNKFYLKVNPLKNNQNFFDYLYPQFHPTSILWPDGSLSYHSPSGDITKTEFNNHPLVIDYKIDRLIREVLGEAI